MRPHFGTRATKTAAHLDFSRFFEGMLGPLDQHSKIICLGVPVQQITPLALHTIISRCFNSKVGTATETR